MFSKISVKFVIFSEAEKTQEKHIFKEMVILFCFYPRCLAKDDLMLVPDFKFFYHPKTMLYKKSKNFSIFFVKKNVDLKKLFQYTYWRAQIELLLASLLCWHNALCRIYSRIFLDLNFLSFILDTWQFSQQIWLVYVWNAFQSIVLKRCFAKMLLWPQVSTLWNDSIWAL